MKLYQYIKKGLIVGSIVVFVMCACQKNNTDQPNEAQNIESSTSDISQNTGEDEKQSQTIDEDESISQDIFAMDTYMTVTAFGSHAQEAVDQAVAEINRLDT